MQKEEIQIGFCCNCDKQIIDFTLKGKDRFLPEYRNHWLKINDGSIMMVAVCDKCDKEMDHAKSESIMKRHHNSWEREIKENDYLSPAKKAESIKHHLSLSVEEFGVDHQKHLSERNADVSEKHKSKRDQWEKENNLGIKKRESEELKIEKDKKKWEDSQKNKYEEIKVKNEKERTEREEEMRKFLEKKNLILNSKQYAS